ncbi:hypothetical protein D3C81_09310 [compost metagenome]
MLKGYYFGYNINSIQEVSYLKITDFSTLLFSQYVNCGGVFALKRLQSKFKLKSLYVENTSKGILVIGRITDNPCTGCGTKHKPTLKVGHGFYCICCRDVEINKEISKLYLKK